MLEGVAGAYTRRLFGALMSGTTPSCDVAEEGLLFMPIVKPPAQRQPTISIKNSTAPVNITQMMKHMVAHDRRLRHLSVLTAKINVC